MAYIDFPLIRSGSTRRPATRIIRRPSGQKARLPSLSASVAKPNVCLQIFMEENFDLQDMSEGRAGSVDKGFQ
jgi:hypothetical protein